jgi:TfoX N-terminal domain
MRPGMAFFGLVDTRTVVGGYPRSTSGRSSTRIQRAGHPHTVNQCPCAKAHERPRELYPQPPVTSSSWAHDAAIRRLDHLRRQSPGGTIAVVPYDEVLADRIRNHIGNDPALAEKKMFGGLAFLIQGNMAVAASGQGGMMVRVDPDQSDALVATTPAQVAVMRGRAMPGWLRLITDDVATRDQLADWVDRGVRYARSLPPKA